MVGEDRAALLAAVVQAIKVAVRDKPVYQSGGGNVMWWPLVAKALADIDHSEPEKPKVLTKRYKRLDKRLGVEGLERLAASVAPDRYQEAVSHVLEHAGAVTGANPPTRQVKVKPLVADVDKPDTLDAKRPATVDFPDLKQKAEPGWGLDFLDKIADVQDAMQALDTQQNVAHAVINTDMPVAVVFPGDFHLGGRGTNHRLMKQDMLMWKALGDAVKVAGMGDYSEQFVGKMAKIGLSQHVMTNDAQIETAMDLFCTTLVNQWLVFVEGNHDGWAGVELARYVMRMAQRCGVPFLGKGGELYLTVGKVEYKLALWHRYPGSSALNRGNNQRRVRIDHNGADVVALAHLHNAYTEFGQTGDINHVGLRCGAYKVTDEHSRDAAGNTIADSRMPMVIFNPCEKDMLHFEDFRKGVETLLRLRREWKDNPSFKVGPDRLKRLLG